MARYQLRMFRAAPLVAIVGSLVLAPAASPQTAPPPPIGMVDLVSGPWRLVQQNRLLARGQFVYEGQTVSVGRSTTGTISIVMFATRQRWEKRCDASAPCQGSYRLPSPEGRKLPSILAFVRSYWTPERELEPIVMGSRSTAAGGAVHALLLRSSGGVDLESSINQVTPGKYAVALMPAAATSPAWRAVIEVGPDARPAAPPELAAGLYTLTLETQSGESVGSVATVLVINEDDAAIRAAWDEARAEADTWLASEATVGMWLVRVLYALDAQRTAR